MGGSTPVVPGRVFMSYRRDDTDFPAGWLYERLSSHLGREQVFKDVDSIELGDDFVQIITSAVGSCDVLLALIGDRWLEVTNDTGQRRLDDPHDFVRLELEAALKRKVRVIPILLGAASMPTADQLPASLSKLTRRQALQLTPARFEANIGRLLRVLDRTLAEQQTQRDAKVKAQAQREVEAKSQQEAEARAAREAEVAREAEARVARDAVAAREAEAKATREAEAVVTREAEAVAAREAEAKAAREAEAGRPAKPRPDGSGGGGTRGTRSEAAAGGTPAVPRRQGRAATEGSWWSGRWWCWSSPWSVRSCSSRGPPRRRTRAPPPASRREPPRPHRLPRPPPRAHPRRRPTARTSWPTAEAWRNTRTRRSRP